MAEATVKTVVDLFLASELDRKPKRNERREILLYLERTNEVQKFRESELAKRFQCSVKTIKKERQMARDAMEANISADKAITFMVDFVKWYDLLIEEAFKGLKEAPKGGLGHPQYIRLIGDLCEKKINKLQSIGVIPEHLGKLTTLEEEWIATASPEGVVDVRKAEETKEGQ